MNVILKLHWTDNKKRVMKKILTLSLGLFIGKISTAQYMDDIEQNTLISDTSEVQSLCAVLSPEGNLCSFFGKKTN